MRIGIIGAGNIGANLAGLFVRAGHQVMFSASSGPDSLRELESKLTPLGSATDVQRAAEAGDIVILALPFRAYKSAPVAQLSGKIVVDATNYSSDRDGAFPDIDSGLTTSSELIAEYLPASLIVKAFNTMYYEHLAQRGDKQKALGDRLAMFLAGDDENAKRAVSQLIEDIGFAPVDTGSLAVGGKRQQPGSPIYNHPMTERDAEQLIEDFRRTQHTL